MKKLISMAVIAVIMVFILTSCKHIEDTNGTDTDLVTISLEKLSGKSISSTSSGVSSRTIRNNITILTQHEEIDNDVLAMSGGLTSGISSIMATDIKKGDTLTIASSTKVDSGNLGLVLISPNNEILHEFIINGDDLCQITAMESGKYFVRMGAESFTGTIGLERTIN